MSLPSTPDGNQMPCESLTVLFDGACPLCRREVSVYQALKPAQPVAWLDVSKPSAALTPDDRARYLARFHVRREDGSLLSGAAAFVALWRVMPGWRWLARFAMLPGVTPVLEQLYRGFLRVRPGIQRLARACDTSPMALGNSPNGFKVAGQAKLQLLFEDNPAPTRHSREGGNDGDEVKAAGQTATLQARVIPLD